MVKYYFEAKAELERGPFYVALTGAGKNEEIRPYLFKMRGAVKKGKGNMVFFLACSADSEGSAYKRIVRSKSG